MAYGGNGQARDAGTAARTPGGRVVVPASDPPLPDLPPPVAAGDGLRSTDRHGPVPGRGCRGREPLPGMTVDGSQPPPHRRESGTRASFSAQEPEATRTLACDGSHRMSFQNCGTYPSPTTGQFNMCNCTPVRTPARGPSQEIRHPSPDSDKAAHRAAGRPPSAHKKDRAGLGGVQRDRRRGGEWALLGQDPRRLEPGFGQRGQLGGQPVCPVIQLFRPRCAAAGCPRAERGPRPRGNGDARRAYGST